MNKVGIWWISEQKLNNKNEKEEEKERLNWNIISSSICNIIVW